MRREDWMRVIAQAADAGCRQIQFIGGEPTLHPDLDDLIPYAHSLGMSFIELYTNATTLTQKRVSFLREYGVRVATSFYSCDESVHENITQRQGSYKRTILGIDNTLKAGLHLRVGVILMDKNSADRDATMTFLRAKGIESIGEDRLRHVGRGGVVHLTVKADPYAELCGNCWKGRACVTASGNCYPCVFSRGFLLGNVLQSSMGQILASGTLHNFRTTQKSRSIPVSEQGKQHNPGEPCSPDACEPVCSPGRNPCAPDLCEPVCNPGRGERCSPDTCESVCSPGRKPEPCAPTTCEPVCNPGGKGPCLPDPCEPVCNPGRGEPCSPNACEPVCSPGRKPEPCAPSTCEPVCSPGRIE